MHDSDYGTQHGKQEVTSPRNVSFFGDLLITLLIFLLAGFLIADMNSFNDRVSSVYQSIIEIKQLEVATEWYKSEFGESPPHPTSPKAIVDHLNRFVDAAAVHPDKFPHDLSTLDEREALCFWLDGQALKDVSKRHNKVFYDFEAARLKDADGDGWLEFYDFRGACFVLSDGEVLLREPVTQATLSSDQLSDRLLLE